MTERGRSVLLVMLVWIYSGLVPVAHGAGPVEAMTFPSAEMEARYRALIDEFRCPKCLNTNLSGSDAPIAHDLRVTVHRLLLAEGMSDQEVRDFLQARYGDFVLYDPPFKPSTWLLWLGPFGFLLVGAWALRRMVRRPEPEEMSDDERGRLQSILNDPNAAIPAAGSDTANATHPERGRG